MSLAEFSGGAAPATEAPTVMGLEEFSGPATPSRLQQGLASAKRMGGEAAAIADLVLGMPAFLIGTGAQLGATVHARAAGVPGEATPGTLYPFTAFTVGREAGREVGETFGSPLHKLMQMFDSGEAYEQAATTKGMEKLSTALEKAGVWVEENTGGRISRDAIPMFAEVLMAGATGIGSGKPKPAIEPHVQKALREQGVKMREQAEIEAASKMLTPEEFVARLPVQQQINELLGIRTPAEQARVTRQRRAETKQVFGTRGPGEEPLPPEIEARGTRQYGDIGESVHYADERTAREAAEAARPVGQAEVLDILQKPGEARTPADLTLLRGARGEDVPPTSQAERRAEPRGMPSEAGLRQALEVAQQGGDEPRIARITNQLNELKRAGEQADQLLYSRQRGRVTPEAAGLLGAAGLGAAAGAVLDEDTLRGATLGGATGLAAVLPFVGRGASIPRSMRQGGAVKAPGGMWHPEAVERLSEPLMRSLRGDRAPLFELRSKFEKPLKDWSDKAIRNYLNKYAGTERDPLKDVEIPFGEGTKSWGDITDATIVTTDKAPGLRQGEKAFELALPNAKERYTKEGLALQNYMSHVGDYLHQNVDPAKLQQYDLVRAVRETAENDRRVAKEMEKAAAASSKDLPVYKEYPDGYRWVELKLPEKLTEEQGKGVRKATALEKRALSRESRDIMAGEEPVSFAELKGQDIYVAVDAQGKPIKNAYTEGLAAAGTPEEAFLAGQLAREGNIMGHCAGGYCPSVASGESRIFSLRDPKGLSHVTVEVEPAAKRLAEGREERSDAPDNISQIKGKQNRAPESKYLPYVQDFVKSGKWGEVGDLGNTGLVREAKTGKYYTPQEARTAGLDWVGTEGDLHADVRNQVDPLPGPGGREHGQIDQRLVVGLGGLGLGGILGSWLSDDPGSGALLGALAGGSLGLPGVQRRLKQAAETADYGVGLISTRIANISPALAQRARLFEMRNLTESHEVLHKVVPFMKALEAVPASKRATLDRAILTNDAEAIAGLMKGNPELVAGWRQVRNVLNGLGKQLAGHGRFKSMKDDYFPRLVKDVEGLKEALGTPERTRLEAALQEAQTHSMRTRGSPLTNIEQSAIINREVQAMRRARGHLPGFAKERAVAEVTERLRPFYFTPSESLYAYVRGAVQDLETAKFFGRDLAQKRVAGQEFIDLDTSIGNVVGRELAAGKITHPQAQQLIDMLQSRLRSGERSSNSIIQDLRNLGNMGLLGNIVSGATQAADAMLAVYATHELRAPIGAVARQLSGRERVTAADFGLADHVAEEFVSATRTANWLNKMFKYSGFAAIDRFGKTTLLNAALSRTERLSQSPSGVARLKEKYGEAYGNEFPALVADLKKGALTERVRSMLFSELSDMQPISKLEMPQGYLDNPNGRLIYMLKTFMMKQIDVVRRDTYNEIKKGNVGRGLKNLVEYGLVLGLSGATTQMVKDWLMGNKVSFEPTDVMEQMLRTFGLGAYVTDRIRQGRPVEAILGAIAPPFKIMDDIIRRDPKAVQYIPLIGKLFYSWELGGREETELREARKEKKAGREIDLSPRAEEYREQKRERNRLRREQEAR